MGFQNIGIVQILIILLIVLLIFGTKRIRTLGSDLGGAIREFRKGVSDDDEGSEIRGDDGNDEPKASDAGNDSEEQKDKKAPGSSGS